MGRKDKHKLGASRNNAVFKVVGAKVKKAGKGRPKEVSFKLRNIKSKEAVAELDAKLAKIREDSVKIGGNKKPAKTATKIEPIQKAETATEKDVDVVMDTLEKTFKSS